MKRLYKYFFGILGISFALMIGWIRKLKILRI